MENESDQSHTPYHIRRIREIRQADEERHQPSQRISRCCWPRRSRGHQKQEPPGQNCTPATPCKSREFTRHSDHTRRRAHGLEDETPSMVLSWNDHEPDGIHGSQRREPPEEVRKVECPLYAALSDATGRLRAALREKIQRFRERPKSSAHNAPRLTPPELARDLAGPVQLCSS